jgi:2,4-diaminopentanoate dehydrogenase
MGDKTYRVIQWATGTVGKVAIRHFVENPSFELTGVWVSSERKAGKDAGEIARIDPTGVIATRDADALIAAEADCVHFAPLVQDIDLVCRLLRSGKNVVSPLGPYYRTERFRAEWEPIEAACRDGGASFHGCGIHPGFAGDLLPLTLTRIMERIDHIHVTEVIDHLANPSGYIEFMGFGRDCDELLANPSRSAEAPHLFAQSMAMVLESLGKRVDDLTTKLEVAAATQDIEYRGGVVRKGTVAGQHYEWTAWSDGAPVMTFHCFWTMGGEHVEPKWDCGESGYKVLIEGNPPMEVTMRHPSTGAGGVKYLGLPWTAMAGVNAIPAVCDAPPGMVTHLDLGVFGPRGLLRSAPN